MKSADLKFARDLARESYGESAQVKPFGASNNLLMRIEAEDGAHILKLASAGSNDDRIAKEIALLERVRNAGIPSPEVEQSDADGASRGRAFILMRSAGDRTVMDWAGQLNPAAAALFEDMGRIHSAIHAISLEATGDISAEGVVETDQDALVRALGEWAEWLFTDGLLSAKDVQIFRAAPIPAAQGTSLCHGDFHAVQCVVADDAAGIDGASGQRISAVVDWEGAWSGNPGIDLAFTHACLDFYASKQLRKSYLTGYTERRELPKDYVHAYLPVRMVQVLGVMRAWHGQGERAWRIALQTGRVKGLVTLFRTYCRLYERTG